MSAAAPPQTTAPAVDLVALVGALDASLGRPPFAIEASEGLLKALAALKEGLAASASRGTLVKDGGTSPDLKMTLAVLATAYPRGSANPAQPNMAVFEGLLEAVVLAFPVITYTLKDLIAQALRIAPRCVATAQLLALTKGFTKENVLILLYGEGVAEELVKAPTRPPPKPKKNAPPPPPWAPPPLKVTPRIAAELAKAYAADVLPADCKPFIYDVFVGHGRFGVVVGDDDVAAAAILDAMLPIIRATLHPLQLLRALSPLTDHYFVKLAEDRPEFAPSLLEAAQTMTDLTARHALNFRASLRRFVSVAGPQQRAQGEFITTAVLCSLATRTTRLLPADGGFGDDDSSLGLPFTVGSPTTPVAVSATTGLPHTDAIPQLLVSGALGYRAHSRDNNAALVHCAEALVVMDRHIGRLPCAVSYDLPLLNEAITRYMDVAMDVATPPQEVGLALMAAMHLVDTVHNYKHAHAAYKEDAPIPTSKGAIAAGANMPACRAVALVLTLDCSRAAGKLLREFAAVWYGHMLRTRSLGLPSIMTCGATPLFIAPKAPKAQAPQAKHAPKAAPKKGGGKAAPAKATPAAATTGAAHTAISDAISLPPSQCAVAPHDGMKTLLFKLLESCGGGFGTTRIISAGSQYLGKMVLQQLAAMEDSDLELSARDRMGLLAALCAVPMVATAQYIVDEVLDAEDADSNPSSDKHCLIKVLVKHAIYPVSRLVDDYGTIPTVGLGLAVEEDDVKWMSFITEVEESRNHTTQSAAEAIKKEASERLAAARKAQAGYAHQRALIAEEQAQAAAAREAKLERQRELVEMVKAIMADREREVAASVALRRERRLAAFKKVHEIDAQRLQSQREEREAGRAAAVERREMTVSLKEYLIDTLMMEPSRVYPILAFLRTQIDSLSSDELHEYLVTGSMTVPLDMAVDIESDELAEVVNLEEHELKSHVAKKYLKTHEGLDFWGVNFAPAEDSRPADTIEVKVAPSAAPTKPVESQGPRYVMSYHRRVAPILDAFNYADYVGAEEEEAEGDAEAHGGQYTDIPVLTREALAVVVTASVLEDMGFANLTEALHACSSKGLLTCHGGEVQLSPLGAAYHAPFAKAERSFHAVFEVRNEQLRKSLEARRAELEMKRAASEGPLGQGTANGIFADQWS